MRTKLSNSPFHVHRIQASIRFIQGYRYLDRCGEALIKLENSLLDGWLPTEAAPKAGGLKNDQLGMITSFNSEAVSCQQSEFISFDHFLDQAGKIYDTLWQLFEIERIHLPSFTVVLQKGFADGELQDASRYLLDQQFCVPDVRIASIMEGEVDALDFVLVTTKELVWNEVSVHQRRRMQGKVVRQERQPPFDDRILKRARHLPEKQREAIEALKRLRRDHPETSPVAVQIEAEHSYESEFRAGAFDLRNFLQMGWAWTESVRDQIGTPRNKR